MKNALGADPVLADPAKDPSSTEVNVPPNVDDVPHLPFVTDNTPQGDEPVVNFV